MTETDVTLPDGRVLHAYDTGAREDGLLPVLWLHGTPNVGTPPRPLFADARRLGLRWLGYDRPGYGGSTPAPGRSIASAADDVAAVLDALGVDRFAAFGHSGGGPHALACAALLGERVKAVVGASGPAPYDADGLDFFAGMAEGSVATLRAAAAGRAAREALEDADEELDPGFVAADGEALAGDWAWFMEVVRPAIAAGPAAAVDDDLALVAPWGFAVADVAAPTLVLHGAADRMIPPGHASWLAATVPGAELRIVPDEGHVSVLRHASSALDWLVERAS
ncbi:alpha/beta hydrolase [Nocardioides sp. KIGAM211]|uniref:Alpha/beta hydrolase n=2 Tax=Nocardioides luti TaxID=2761101 RepID=A0A7X0RGG2_9ACTN|nr:alpha/beta hydrolase [Nocardioides luti]MBB6627849.1 alpha/beta hydrolase [Nocardioides luti]